jgi:predicted NAD/FAD-binding protein
MGELTSAQTRRRVAVIGSGVSGLTAAWILARDRDVTLYEADARLGGHADTHRVTAPDGTALDIDTGFIVHNTRTYPLLTRLFGELGVAVQPSEMSMSVRCLGCGLEYAGQRGLPGIAAGLPRGRGRYLRMLTEIGRFHAAARALLRREDPGGGPAAGPSLGQFLAAGRYSDYCVTHFVLPFVAAVWSCAPGTALDYPARYLFRFLDQHGLLTVTGSPPWLTVTGGSARYVELIAKQLSAVRAGTPVTSVRRFPGGAEVTCGGGPAERYAGVVVATHPDQALALLADSSPAEREVLGAFRYSRNTAVLHTGSAVLPTRRAARASWNYTLSSCSGESEKVQVSYYMNRLQRIGGERDYIVTLNGDPDRAGGEVLDCMEYAHPVYDAGSVAAQARLPELSDGVTAFAGAYHGWGFHEDGCRSGVAAAASLGARW